MSSCKAELEPLVTLAEAASILRRSHWMLRRDAREGRILVVRIGRALMVSPDELRRLLSQGLPMSNANEVSGTSAGTNRTEYVK
jgi:hypothetical protein